MPNPDLAMSAQRSVFTAATQSMYDRAQRAFRAWCTAQDLVAVPASIETMQTYLEWCSRRWGRATLQLHVSALADLQKKHGHPLDTARLRLHVKALTSGDCTPAQRAAALDATLLKCVLSHLPHDLKGHRDRALLLLGFSGALRPGELLRLVIGEGSVEASGRIEFGANGCRIDLKPRKSEQRAVAVVKHIPRGPPPCPVEAIEHWLRQAKIEGGWVFRRLTRMGSVMSGCLTSLHLRTILRERVRNALHREEYTPAEIAERLEGLKGYSLRSGFVTTAIARGVDELQIAQHLGWSSSNMAVRYHRPGAKGDPELVDQVLTFIEQGGFGV